MRNAKKIVASFVIASTVWAIGSTVSLAKGPNIEISGKSKIWFNGESTLHPYSATSKEMKVNIAIEKAGKDWNGAKLSDLDVSVPVKSLKSGDGLLDANMYRTMEADKYPTIKFAMSNAKMKIEDSGDVSVKADGKLNINGVEKNVALEAEGKLTGDSFKLTGSKELKMSDFGIQPPNLMMGTIKCKDQIEVKFELVGSVKD